MSSNHHRWNCSGKATRETGAPASRSAETWLAALMLCLSGLLLVQPLGAQGVKASVNQNQVALDSQVLLTVTVEGTQNARPTLPELPDFRVISRGGVSREMSTVNGAMTQRVHYQFILIPSRVGRFTIGPVTATIEGQQYRSASFSIQILNVGQEPKEQAETFLTVSVSNDNPFVGEQVIYTWRFYRRVRVADARITALDFGDLIAEELGEVREFDTNYKGLPYRVSEVRRALFAQRAGVATIDPAELTCEIPVRGRGRSSIFGFGRVQTQTKVLRSRGLELNVKALPQAPATFSGLVGEFSARSSLSKNELKVGESATFELEVKGVGNIQLMREPRFPQLAGFKIYEDQPISRIVRTGSALRGTRTFRKALVPLAAGVIDLPAIELVYFDPKAGRFRSRSTETIPVRVLPGVEDEDLMLTESLNPGAGKIAVRVLADDILPIRTDFTILRKAHLSTAERAGWLTAAVVPPVLVAFIWGIGRRRDKFASDLGLRTRQGAFRKAMSALGTLSTKSTAPLSELAADAALTLRTYVGERLDATGEAMTPEEVESTLLNESVDAAVARETRESLERLEALVFGGDSRRFTGKQLSQSVEQIVREVEAELASGFRVDGRPSRWFSGRERRSR